ncbi:MAG: class I SAM-dependent methyltransferase [Promethearchaeota archaeon]|nr:MAG: class I SAM-dependent methyltransferase [Candidatus Lokiarchaeota archaeon]
MIMYRFGAKTFLKQLNLFLRKNLFSEFRFSLIPKFLTKTDCTILDVGCGNYSPQRAKLQYPHSHYYGLDLSKNYYSSTDLSLMDGFFELDLNKLDYSPIPNNFFDLIILSHVLEHLPKGERVLLQLLPKLKSRGLIYIEYPSVRSTKLPHKKGTLNFYDDATHVRIYDNKSLSKILKIKGFEILKEGVRRDYKKILLLPILLIYDLFKYRHIKTGHLWDLFGFADYLIAYKKV